jgi:hypothetical protein
MKFATPSALFLKSRRRVRFLENRAADTEHISAQAPDCQVPFKVTLIGGAVPETKC